MPWGGDVIRGSRIALPTRAALAVFTTILGLRQSSALRNRPPFSEIINAEADYTWADRLPFLKKPEVVLHRAEFASLSVARQDVGALDWN